MCRCAHTSLGLGRGEYPSNPPSAPTSPHGQPEAATDVKEAGEETGRGVLFHVQVPKTVG